MFVDCLISVCGYRCVVIRLGFGVFGKVLVKWVCMVCSICFGVFIVCVVD